MSDDGQGRTVVATPGGPSRSGDPLIGIELAGRYKIERKLGEGGMGSVYVARHTTLDKLVAVKILHGEYARKPDLIERFLQEARAASKIRHENVIDITDFGTTADGLVFFCMELLSGHDLHDVLTRARIEGRPIPWSRSGPIFLQVCAALHAAHASGVIHRDLKPENIFLINWLGTADFVKLLDFGIAKMTETVEGEDGGRKLTKTGMLFGTPEYMSPEQARGDKPDARVDVYAMGCILFQLLTGDTPFTGDSFMAVLSQHLTAEPPAVTPAQLAAVGAPPGLAAVVARALLKDRDARYATIKELADAVRQVPEAQPDSGAVPRPVATTGKSVWTGSARIPVEANPTVEPAADHARTAKILWAMVAAVVIIGGGIVAAVALAGGGGGDEPDPEPAPHPAIVDPEPAPEPPTPVLVDAAPAPAEQKPEARIDPEPAPRPKPEPARVDEPEPEPPAPEPEPKPDPDPVETDPTPGDVKLKSPF